MKKGWLILLVVAAAYGLGRTGTPAPPGPSAGASSPLSPAIATSPAPSTAMPNSSAPPRPQPPAAPLGSQRTPMAVLPPATVPAPSAAVRPPAAQGPTVDRQEIAYVRGDRVALRAAANPEARILDRLNDGQTVTRLSRQGEWWRVRHELTRQEGWINARRLSSEPASQRDAEPNAPSQSRAINPSAALATTAIITLIIEESVSAYRATRPCACPYHRTSSGRSCGGNSAWSRPGGAKPLCYPEDVTPQMIAAFRARPRS